MTISRVIRRTIIYRGRVIRLIQEVMAVGRRTLVREMVEHPGAVVVVPLLDASHEELLTRADREPPKRACGLASSCVD